MLRDPDDVTLLEVIELMDGPVEDEQCLLGKAICLQEKCILQPMLADAQALIVGHLKRTRLSHFTIDPRLVDHR